MTPATGDTPPVLLALIGAGIGASRAPFLHMREAAAQGLTCIYRLVDTDRLGLHADALPDLLAAAERFGFNGLNITFPFKQAVLPHLTDLSPDARALGAVNTVLLRDGRRIGHNTDWSGYAASFRAAMADAARQRVVLMGAGGAGAAVAYALLTLGVDHLAVADTDTPRATTLTAQMAACFGADRIALATDPEAAIRAADGVVNATPVGMAAFPGTPFPPAWLNAHQWLSEVIYFPIETELLRHARALGCRTLDGSGMNIGQAADAFRLFTGREPDTDSLRRLFHEAAHAE